MESVYFIVILFDMIVRKKRTHVQRLLPGIHKEVALNHANVVLNYFVE